MSEKKVSIFDLHRKIEVHDITDGDQVVRIGLRSPSHAQSVNTLELLAEKRDEMEQSDKSALIRKQVEFRAENMPLETVVSMIMLLEEPTVRANLDLAPAPGEASAPEEETEAKMAEREQAAMERWNKERREALSSMAIGPARATYVELQTRIAIQAQALAAVQLHELVLMVVDPDTKEPMFSLDEKADDFIGNLASETIAALTMKKNEYLSARNEQRIREQTKSGPFSRRGGSRRRLAASPGATTATPSISAPVPSDSSAVASG